jgi:hypothetical protein
MKTDETSEFDFEGMPKENPFTVPAGYFDRFPASITERIHEENKVSPRTLFIRPSSLAAAAVFLIIAGVLGYRYFIGSTNELTNEEISTYVSQEGIIDEVEVDELIENPHFALNSDTTAYQKYDTEKTEIQNYLLEEGIEDSDIINEL